MRSPEQVIWDFVRQWLKKAEADRQSAKILLDTDLNDHFPCAFHCQQAAEKFLKAYLVRHQVEFRKTHDLDELLKLADSVDLSLGYEIASCVWLTPYGVEFRYPGEYPEVDHDTAARAYKEKEVELVGQAIMKRLNDYLSKGRPE
jgi:HEPN domain-containing protein